MYKIQMNYKKWQIYVILSFTVIIIMITLLYMQWQKSLCEDYTAFLEVTLDKQVYSQGEPVSVTTKLKPITAPGIVFAYGGSPLMESDIYLFDHQGQTIPLTNEGWSESSGSRIISILRPEEEPYERTFRIDTWFDLSESGIYTLTLEKFVPYEGCSGTVDKLSDTVTFTRLP